VKSYLLNQAESGVNCPLTMTFACVPALRCQPDVTQVTSVYIMCICCVCCVCCVCVCVCVCVCSLQEERKGRVCCLYEQRCSMHGFNLCMCVCVCVCVCMFGKFRTVGE